MFAVNDMIRSAVDIQYASINVAQIGIVVEGFRFLVQVHIHRPYIHRSPFILGLSKRLAIALEAMIRPPDSESDT